jgi:hypothetical protein
LEYSVIYAVHYQAGLLLFRYLFGLLWTDVDFLFLGRLLEVPDPFSQPFTNLREFSSPENDQNDDQDDDQLRHSDSKHLFLLFTHLVIPGLTRNPVFFCSALGNTTFAGNDLFRCD